MNQERIIWITLAILLNTVIGYQWVENRHLELTAEADDGDALECIAELGECNVNLEEVAQIAMKCGNRLRHVTLSLDELHEEREGGCEGKLAKCNEGYNGQIDATMIAFENTDEVRAIAEKCLGRELKDEDFEEKGP